MSRSRQPYGGPKLPQSIIDRVSAGDERREHRGRHGLKKNSNDARKEKRKLDRNSKSSGKHDYKSRSDGSTHNQSKRDTRGDEKVKRLARSKSELQPLNSRRLPANKKHSGEATEVSAVAESEDLDERGLPSSLSVPRQSKTSLKADDAEIAALERRLGIKSRSLPKSFYDDGLGDVFGEDHSDQEHQRKRKVSQDEDWLQRKRQKDELRDDTSDDGSAGSEGDDSDEAASSLEETSNQISEPSDGPEELTGFESSNEDEDHKDSAKLTRPKENPYVPPVTSLSKEFAKYVPPARRVPSSNDVELSRRLQRQIQGLLNRVSDSNLLSIVRDIEKLYQKNPRQYVTSILVELLIGLISDRTTLNDTMVILHAGFIAALYKSVGPDFGAQMVEGLVSSLDKNYPAFTRESDSNKEYLNLMSLAAQLFNFGVITSDLIFDYLRIHLDSLGEANTEVLLRIVRISGSQLRQDDPSSLKDLVQLLQQNVAAASEGSLSVRTRFMIETISDLKNNRLKAGAATSAVVADYASQIKKTLGLLNSRGNVRAAEPLRLTLDDVRTSEKRGKWWLVGSSWKGRTKEPTNSAATHSAESQNALLQQSIRPNEKDSGHSSDSSNDDTNPADSQDITALATANGMNTPLRRQIFAILMTSTDYQEACNKLLKLPITKKQKPEIARVLLRCAAQEKWYNHYYTLIARRLCRKKPDKMWKTFRFCLWDLLKSLQLSRSAALDLNEGDSEDGAFGQTRGLGVFGAGDQPGETGLTARVNLAKLYGNLIADGALNIFDLQHVDFVALISHQSANKAPSKQSAGVTFLELLFVTIIVQIPRSTSKSKIFAVEVDGVEEQQHVSNFENVFSPVLQVPNLHNGLKLFVTRIVRSSDLVATDKERKKLKEGCQRIADLLPSHEGR